MDFWRNQKVMRYYGIHGIKVTIFISTSKKKHQYSQRSKFRRLWMVADAIENQFKVHIKFLYLSCAVPSYWLHCVAWAMRRNQKQKEKRKTFAPSD